MKILEDKMLNWQDRADNFAGHKSVILLHDAIMVAQQHCDQTKSEVIEKVLELIGGIKVSSDPYDILPTLITQIKAL